MLRRSVAAAEKVEVIQFMVEAVELLERVVEGFAQALPQRARRLIDLVAWTVLLAFTALLVWKIGGRVLAQFPGGEVRGQVSTGG